MRAIKAVIAKGGGGPPTAGPPVPVEGVLVPGGAARCPPRLPRARLSVYFRPLQETSPPRLAQYFVAVRRQQW